MDRVTANIGFNYAHLLHPNTTHGINVFYSPGVTATMDRSHYQTVYGTAYNIAHRLNRAVTIVPMVGWMHSQSEGSLVQQEYDVLNVNLNRVNRTE